MAVRHSNVVVVKRLIMTSVAAVILKLCASLLLMMVNTIQFDIIVLVKFMFSEKAKKIDKIFTVHLTVSNRQMDGEDLVNFCGLLIKREL